MPFSLNIIFQLIKNEIPAWLDGKTNRKCFFFKKLKIYLKCYEETFHLSAEVTEVDEGERRLKKHGHGYSLTNMVPNFRSQDKSEGSRGDMMIKFLF